MNSTYTTNNILNKDDAIKIEIRDSNIKQESESEPILQDEKPRIKSTWDNLEDISIETLNEIQELYTGHYLEEYRKYIDKIFPQNTDINIKTFSKVSSNTKKI
jgi:hypothetical protein